LYYHQLTCTSTNYIEVNPLKGIKFGLTYLPLTDYGKMASKNPSLAGLFLEINYLTDRRASTIYGYTTSIWKFRITVILLLAMILSIVSNGCATHRSDILIESPPADRSAVPDTSEFVEFDKAPELIYPEEPNYPRAARVNKLTGTVWLKSLVNTDGKVDSVIVAKVSGVEGAGFEKSAIKAAYKKNGIPQFSKGSR